MIVLPHPGPNGDGESDDGDSDDEKMSDEEVKILLAQIGDTLANHLLPVPLMHILMERETITSHITCVPSCYLRRCVPWLMRWMEQIAAPWM